jgi:hypothetical protein
MGFDRYKSTLTNAEKYIKTFKIHNVFYLLFNEYWGWGKSPKEVIDDLKKNYTKGGRELYIYPEQTIGGAWSDDDFGISVTVNDKESFAFIKKLAKAIEVGDFAVWQGGEDSNNPFARAGLVVAIASLVPQELKDYMLKCHEDEKKLKDADEATGIKALLKEKNKGFFACSPHWMGERFKDTTSNHPVIYWLNPMEQDENNYGWFTVEQLTDWANGVKGNKITKIPEPTKIKV